MSHPASFKVELFVVDMDWLLTLLLFERRNEVEDAVDTSCASSILC